MHGAFDDEDFEPIQRRRDTELTLGNFTLLIVFFGLVLLCALFFGLGYAMGHHAALQPSPAGQESAAKSLMSTMAASVRPKPSATPQANSAASSRPAPSTPPSSTTWQAHPASGSQNPVPAQPQVRPALPVQTNSATPNRADTAPVPAGGFMVQIAAVSNPEDSDVLVTALRRRGYAVSAHREAADGLIHVRIGPFSNRNDANQWRKKLLNDGYNAILQP
jgi:cell division septation protein DedD